LKEDLEIKRSTILFAILFAAVGDVAKHAEILGTVFASAFVAIAVIVFAISKSGNFSHYLFVIFGSITGLMVGSGYLIKSLLLAIVGYFVLNYLENILEKPQENSPTREGSP